MNSDILHGYQPAYMYVCSIIVQFYGLIHLLCTHFLMIILIEIVFEYVIVHELSI